MGNEKVCLTPEEVDSRLVPGEYVHTFVQAGGIALIGADWKRSEILDAAKKFGAELGGESCMAMKHGVVVYDGTEPVFCETLEQ